MSVNYAQGLSDYPNKGVCGLPEISEPRDQIESKVQQLIRWIKESQKTVFFVGAGISTVCGIPDFRGPCGVWTMQQKHENARNKRMKTKEDAGLDAEKKSKIARIHEESKMEDGRKREDVSVNQLKDPLDAKTLHPLNEAIDKCEMINFNQAKPSYTHLGITEMVNRNLIQLVVSQNVDGLFLRTGLARKHLCEMHGNFYLDECSYCLAR